MKNQVVIGKMELKADPQGQAATLLFTPDPEGPEWNPDILKAFLEKEKVTHGYTIQTLTRVLSQLSQPSDGPVSVPVAEAVPPGEPLEDKLEWKEFTIPPAREEDARAFFNHAGPPRIFKIRYENVEVVKTEEVKSLFGTKERQITKREKREIREPVAVDPRVLGEGWAEKGALLCEILPGNPGEDGVNVFGRPLAGEKPRESLLLGEGVERTGNEVRSVHEGFVRRGENWVEVLPFSAHDWEVSLSKDQNTFLLSFSPGGEKAVPPAPELVLKDAVDRGAAEDTLLSAYEVGTLLQRAIDHQKPLNHVPISTPEDGFFKIEVSQDKLRAFLSMRKGRGQGKPLVLKEFGKALKEAGFSGIDYARVQSDILAFYKGPEKVLNDYVLVEGTPPEPPGEISIQMTMKNLPEDDVAEMKRRFGENASDPEWIAGVEKEVPSITEHPLETVDRMAVVTKGAMVAEISFEPGKPGKDVYGQPISSGDVTDSGLRLLEGLEKRGNQIFTTLDGVVDQWDKPEGPLLRARVHQDGVITIILSADRMSGFLSLQKAQGTGRPLTQARVEQAYGEKGITTGIDAEVVHRAVVHANEGQDIQKLVFASGKHPVEGDTEKWELLVEVASQKGVTLRADGTADYRNQDLITLVRKDQLLGRITRSGEPPQDGCDVTGQTISPKQGSPLEIIAGDNVREDRDEGGNSQFFAEKGGEFFFERGILSVSPVHTVSGNVGKTSGNIKFSGTVKVAGYVQAGYFIMAGEDVFIKDNIEAALVSAGGKVFVEKGVVGGGKAVIRARKTITASFAEQCTLLAVENISLQRGCMKCSVKTNGKLLLEKDKSVLLGGKVLAREGVTAFNIGSDKQVATHISFGQDYLVFDQIEVEEKELNKAKESLVKLDFKMKQAEKDGLAEAVQKLRAEKIHLMKIIEKRGMRSLMLREKFEEHYPGEIRVKGTLYPGVTIESHGRTLDITQEYKNVSVVFELETGRLQIKEKK